jgi:hypothetical protein
MFVEDVHNQLLYLSYKVNIKLNYHLHKHLLNLMFDANDLYNLNLLSLPYSIAIELCLMEL